ncbi:MAG: EAL domain-containing protein [Cyanobacteriota bacterium]|nr:EAL domain-containing protein [Cyanobacteriota bacterium]
MASGDLHIDLLALLADTAEAFITKPTSELDATIDQTLASIGAMFDVDRAYVFSLTRFPGLASNTHEWCASGVQPQIDQLQFLPQNQVAWWMQEMRAGRAINLESLADLPPDATAEREILSSQGIQSLLVLPLVRRGHLEGFAGFDHIRGRRHWNEQEVAVLSIVVSSFAQAFERRLVDERLRQLAYQDPLTCLPNRTLLSQRLALALESARTDGLILAVGYLDLDDFKPINDRHGHAEGDRLLLSIAERLCGCLRPGDTVGRLGGDEFVVILPGLRDLAELEELGHRLLAAVAEPMLIANGVPVAVTTSIGFRLVPPDPADPDTLLRQADQAMYVAKRNGPGRIHFFDVESDRRDSEQRSYLQAIRLAFRHDQLRLFVQPVIDLTTGHVCFVEALVRWQHPRHGLLSPDQWLPWIEDQPEIFGLGDWVLERALAFCCQWLRDGLCSGISVNISAMELRDHRFPERIQSVLARHPQFPASALKLEVLETAALEDLDHVGASMQICREMGVGFALDDFGTGYSSLTYLRRLPISTIKIDRSFVAQMLAEPEDEAIVKAVIDLARAFGRTCVAEGVESSLHLERLRSLGCGLAQGFAIAPPMPAEELSAWCLQRQGSIQRQADC